jgi:pseudouridine kinase
VDPSPLVVVVGGANLDVKARSARPVVAGTSNPGTVVRTPGGVGRNIAENLARLGSRVALLSAVGSDPDGEWLLGETAVAGVDVSTVSRTAHGTGTYAAVLDADGELVVSVSDMAAVDAIDPEQVEAGRALLASAALVVLDGNLAAATVDRALDLARELGVRALFDPVSVPKAARLAALLRADRPMFAVTPNAAELAALAGTEQGAVMRLHERGVEVVWVRRGLDGSLLSSPSGVVELPALAVEAVDVTGAGDAMLAAFCHRLLAGADLADAAAYGHRAAALTVASPHTVRPDLRERMA